MCQHKKKSYLNYLQLHHYCVINAIIDRTYLTCCIDYMSQLFYASNYIDRELAYHKGNSTLSINSLLLFNQISLRAQLLLCMNDIISNMMYLMSMMSMNHIISNMMYLIHVHE